MSSIPSWFQSTPVIANGRISPCVARVRQLTGFNPRPLLLTGESGIPLRARDCVRCFNPRPLLLTGESIVENDALAPDMFQSTPVIANGRISHANKQISPSATGFNPRPLLLTGESASKF